MEMGDIVIEPPIDGSFQYGTIREQNVVNFHRLLAMIP